jgi:hypothetical protein
MPRVDGLREEIGWLKVGFAALIAIDASLVGWLAQNYGSGGWLLILGGFVATAVVTCGVARVNRSRTIESKRWRMSNGMDRPRSSRRHGHRPDGRRAHGRKTPAVIEELGPEADSLLSKQRHGASSMPSRSGRTRSCCDSVLSADRRTASQV